MEALFSQFDETTEYTVEQLYSGVEGLSPGCVLEVLSWPSLPLCVIAACAGSGDRALPAPVTKTLDEVRPRAGVS